MLYQQELQEIKDVYGVDRWSRMKDLVDTKDGWDGKDAKSLDPRSMNMFIQFVRIYGKVADDMAMFLGTDGNLEVNWTYWLDDPKRQRRGGLTRHVSITFCPHHVEVFRDEEDDDSWCVQLVSHLFKDVIEKYRSHRLSP